MPFWPAYVDCQGLRLTSVADLGMLGSYIQSGLTGVSVDSSGSSEISQDSEGSPAPEQHKTCIF